MATITQKDLETISAYIDHALDARGQARLEARLRKEPELRQELEKLRFTRQVLRAAPRLRAPRNFTLTPEMAGAVQPARTLPFNLARLAFALASVFLVFSLVGNFTVSRLPAAANDTAAQSETIAMEAPEAEVESLPLEEAESAPAEEPAAALEAASEEAAATDSAADMPSGGSGVLPEATPGEQQAFAPPTDEAQAMVVEGATQEAERMMAVEESAAPKETEILEAAPDETLVEAPSEVPEPDDGVSAGSNFWVLAAWISGAAALLSGGLALLLRRR